MQSQSGQIAIWFERIYKQFSRVYAMNHKRSANSDVNQNEATGLNEQSTSVNTSIMIRPYAEYFTRKEEAHGFFRMIRKNWSQMSILWPGKMLAEAETC